MKHTHSPASCLDILGTAAALDATPPAFPGATVWVALVSKWWAPSPEPSLLGLFPSRADAERCSALSLASSITKPSHHSPLWDRDTPAQVLQKITHQHAGSCIIYAIHTQGEVEQQHDLSPCLVSLSQEALERDVPAPSGTRVWLVRRSAPLHAPDDVQQITVCTTSETAKSESRRVSPSAQGHRQDEHHHGGSFIRERLMFVETRATLIEKAPPAAPDEPISLRQLEDYAHSREVRYEREIAWYRNAQ